MPDIKEKLVELLDKQKGYTLPIWTAPQTIEIMVDALIANGATIQKWISVEERLPEPKHEMDARNWYLVALSSGVVKELAYEFHEHSVFGSGWRETAYPVTHWMPLPEPPKEMKEK